MSINHLHLVFASLILCLITGCTKELTFDELISDLPKASNTKSFSNSEMNYSFSLPEEFEPVEKEYSDTLWFELFLDKTIPYERGSNMISIVRILSKEKTPKDVWQNLFEKKLSTENYTLHSKGETNFLEYPSYYAHYSNTISDQNRETVIFIVRGKSSDFYVINIETGTEKTYPDNMKKLLSHLRTFHILN